MNFNLDVKAKINGLSTIESNMAEVKKQALAIKEHYEKLVITEEMIPEIKKEKAEVNKAKGAVSDYRKNIVKDFNKPLEEFVNLAKETEKALGDTYNSINDQVAKYENETKAKKEEEIKTYFADYAAYLQIDFVPYERAGINVTLSASAKSLKATVKAFLDKVKEDLNLIDTQDHKAEILAEYKQTLDVSKSILTIKDRIEREEREKVIIEEKAKAEVKKEVPNVPVEEIIEVHAPQEIKEEPTYTMTFKVEGTMDQLKKVKEFLEKEGIKYDRA